MPWEHHPSKIIRTERGLTIAGTRISLYDILDLLKADYPPKLIRDSYNLTDVQLETALSYIEENEADIESEYQEVLKNRAEIRQHWEDKNQERLTLIARKTRASDQNVAWAKLRNRRAERAAQQ